MNSRNFTVFTVVNQLELSFSQRNGLCLAPSSQHTLSLSAERCSGIIWVRSKNLKFTCDALDNFISLQLSGVSEHIIITASPHTILISGSCSCPIGFRTNRHNGDQLSWHSPIVLFGSYMKSCLRKHFIDPLMLMFLASMSRDGACRMKNGSLSAARARCKWDYFC